ncbi:MAG: hypothetical protein DIU55_003430 [Bacillota bacterium]
MTRRAWWVVLTFALVLAAQWAVARGHADLAVKEEVLAGSPTLHVAAAGEPRGTVIVLHGPGGSKEMMQHWGYALARLGFDAYIPDLPGHGAHTAPLADPGGAVARLVEELVASGRADPDRLALMGRSPAGFSADAGPLPETAANLLDRAAQNPLTPLYDGGAVAEAAGQLSLAFGTEPPAPPAPPRTGVWLILGLAGGLGAPLAVAVLVRPDPRKAGRRQRPVGLLTGLAAVAVSLLSAVLAAVYLRVPRLGVAALDHLVPYFLVAAAVLLLLRLLWPQEFGAAPAGGGESVAASLLRGIAVVLAFLGAVVPVIHQNITYFVPTIPRILPVVAAVLVYGLYAVQVEGLKRAVSGGPSPAGFLLGLAAKLLMVATWIGAGALPNPPAFLPAAAPAALAVLVGAEILSGCLAALRFSPLSAALVEAVIIGWTAAVTLPLV